MAERQWALNQVVAWQGRGGWQTSIIYKVGNTQATLANQERFRLSDGLLIGAAARTYVKPLEEVKDLVDRDNAIRAAEAERNTQRRRMINLIDKMRNGAYRQLSTEQMQTIADFIEATLPDLS